MPEMARRGYKKPMSIGPIVGAGGLAMLIPPSALAVIWASLAYVSVGKILIAGVIPGVLVAFLYASYVLVRCLLQPSLAPRQEEEHIALSEKIVSSIKYILPLAGIIFLVVGVIFFGIATPTEASGTGAMGTLVLAGAYKRLNRDIMKKCIKGTMRVTVMVLMIILASKTFSQLLSFSGATRGMVEFITNLGISKIVMLVMIQFILLFLGMFMEQASIMMVTIPIFMPIVHALAIEPVWFGILFLLTLEVGLTTPPFGILLFVMKGIAPPDVTMGDIWRAAAPFIACDVTALVLIICFPMIALWLPNIGG
jgi:tripartite ATP-independent transporter DctM subunit